MSGSFQGAIFNVDGVLVGSPHERGEGDYLSVSASAGDRSPVSLAVGDDLREIAPGTQAVFRLGRERDVPDPA